MAFGISGFSESPFSTLSGQSALVAVSGLGASTALGSTTVGLKPTITGFGLTSVLGSPAVQGAVNVTGQSMTAAVGGVGVSAGHKIEPAGQGLTTAIGSVGIGPAVTGFGLTSALGTTEVQVDRIVETVTGQAMTTGLGSVSIEGKPLVPGLPMSMSLGGTSTIGNALVEPNPPVTTETLTVKVISTGSGNKYEINGVQQQLLTLKEGKTYIFNGSDSSVASHPLLLSTTSDGSHNSGSPYETGVTYQINGSNVTRTSYLSSYASATTRSLTITVAASAPTLYYYCHVHSGMGGQANTVTNTDYTGQSGSVGLGSVSIKLASTALPAGQFAIANLGTISVFNNAVATPTGLSMTTALGTPAVYGWQEVNDSVTSNWTNVDDSATMDWKDAA
tara:strand:- start:3738 stop:4910 length:1173 start_codon:yes stop_codon:yes gene_type:complete